MNNNELFVRLKSKFKNGINYNDAVEVCLAIYCSADWVKNLKEESCSKENIALAFSSLANVGIILCFDLTVSEQHGVTSNSFTDKKHWIQIMDNALNLKKIYDRSRVSELLKE